MISILLLTYLTGISASSPVCQFGNQDLFFTTDPIQYTDYDVTCQEKGAQGIFMKAHMIGDQVVPWLLVRRGMRSCKTLKAFVHCEGTKKAMQDGVGECCVVSPTGVQRFDECPRDLSLPALCWFTS